MKLIQPLQPAILVKRYKRFLVDVTLADGDPLTIHCPNTGSMLGLTDPGNRVWYSTSDNLNRKYPHTLDLLQLRDGAVVGVNTSRANSLVQEGIETGVIKELAGYETIHPEYTIPGMRTRMDFRLSNGDEHCYVEVKNVTLGEADGQGYFPDAVTTRGQKHLQTLWELRQQGARAVLCFCVQHTGIERVAAAEHIDATYSQLYRQAQENGVEVIAYQARLSPEEMTLAKALLTEKV